MDEQNIPLDHLYPNYSTSIVEKLELAMLEWQRLEADGAVITPTDAEMQTAREIFVNGEDIPIDGRAITLGVGKYLSAMLDAYDQEIVKNATSLRIYVTNRLLEESNHKDARVRIKALELLGKLSDVGAFTEKAEVLYKNKTVQDIELAIHKRLERITGHKVEDAVIVSEARRPSEITLPTFLNNDN